MEKKKEINKVLKYFSFFAYYPTLDEIYTFLRVKINKKKLKYTPPQYSIRSKISKKKLQNWRFRMYIKILSLFPQIKLVGLSGSISMMNADLDDDIDLFIITEKNRLFTARFVATVTSFIMGLKRSIEQNEAPNKVCLNLFFDENDLTVPKYKKTGYIAHEILQMKPLVNKDQIYERFLEANKWVFKLFPNAISTVIPRNKVTKNRAKRNKLGDWLENLLKKFQLILINRHKTTEIITSTQLWFHPDDFEKKIKSYTSFM